MLAAYGMHEDRSILGEPERDARTEFVEGFSRRLVGLREALSALKSRPDDKSVRDQLQRRLHAVATATQVLGLSSASEALLDAVRLLEQTARSGASQEQLQILTRVLEIVPQLLHERPPPAAEEVPSASPMHVLVFGAPFIVAGLTEGRRRIECFLTEDFSEALEHLRTHGPNVAIVDSGARQARQLIRAITSDCSTEAIPVLVLTPPGEGNDQHFIQAGAAGVLRLPLSPEDLRRALFSFGNAKSSGLSQAGLGSLDLATLSKRIAEEIQAGLVDSALTDTDDLAIDFGQGSEVIAAVWGALAKVRQVVALASSGQVRFKESGPLGGVVLESLSSRGGVAREAGSSSQVELKGRKVVVADDDPAIVWLLADVLQSVGMQVFEAKDGEQALELVRDNWPDLLITDVVMPKLDGLELCRQLKRDIAVRDVPVILLSWKEDLLQRVRELGVVADGYIRKETDASTLMERVREVLRPRARVETRLLARAPVSGRLDGLTPRWLLDSTRQNLENARIQLRDAAYVYEVEMREGEPVTATRTNGEGLVERGRGMLRAFLGVSAGRFEVKPENTSLERELFGSLEEQILPLIDAAREIAHQLISSALLNIERVELDRDMALGYLASTPLSARLLTERLLAGASPRELVLSGEFSPSSVHSVLWDLNQHGAIQQLDSVDLSLCVPEVTAAPYGFSFQLSPEPPRVFPLADDATSLQTSELTPVDLGSALVSLAANDSPEPARVAAAVQVHREASVPSPEPSDESPVDAVIAAEAIGFGGTPDAPSTTGWPTNTDEVSPAAPPVASEEATAEPHPRNLKNWAKYWAKSIAPPAAAAMVAFGLVRYLVVPSLQPAANESPSPNVAPPTAAAAKAPAASNEPPSAKPLAKSAPSTPQIEVLPPPEGIPVPQGLGLLLLETGARHSFYLDGDFIGVGPRRYAQLPPGQHEVKLQLASEQQTFSVTITPGKMTRVRPAEGLATPATP